MNLDKVQDLIFRVQIRVIKIATLPIRWMAIEISMQIARNRRFNPEIIRLFNLDLHPAVISDLEMGLKKNSKRNIQLTRWSISDHNHIFRKFFYCPDPVAVVNAKTWRHLDQTMIRSFQRRYRDYLSTFDGFVVTHTPAFAELFGDFGKPILVVASTRYEAPYTNQPEQWARLNKFLLRGIESGQVTFWSNNVGDRDYFEYLTGFRSKVVPSLCDYTEVEWTPTYDSAVYFAKSNLITSQLSLHGKLTWKVPSKLLGRNYSLSKLAAVSAVFVLPYQISTMRLFELATMGVPVLVPSKAFILSLRKQDPMILNEVSYFRVWGIDESQIDEENPNRNSDSNFEWWLDRADFYDKNLMPNVFEINSFHELENWKFSHDRQRWVSEIYSRNVRIDKCREAALSEFIETTAKGKFGELPSHKISKNYYSKKLKKYAKFISD